jgi:hypothetical protein
MRVALFVLASGLALSLAAPTCAAEFVPDAQQFSAPKPVSATPVSATPATATQAGPIVQCHHMIHEGLLTPIVHCVSARTWERTRLETQQSIMEFQHHSYVVPVH